MSSGGRANRMWLATAPPFCASPGHVDDADALAFEMGGHAEDGADGDDAGAADAGDDHPVGLPSIAAAPAPAAPAYRRQRRRRGRACSFAPSTVTKDGQKPFTQE